MFKQSLSFKTIYSGFKDAFKNRNFSKNTSKHIKLDKILIVSKLSRYQFERKKLNDLNECQFENELRNRGTDFEKLMHNHNLHKNAVENVANTLKNLGIEVKIVNRFCYSYEDVDYADVIMPTGGDGTFLLGASRVRDNKKPVIGINSDPNRSEGYLCLPKKYSCNVREAIEKLQSGNFTWMLRNRIRTTIVYQKGEVKPSYLHEAELNPCDVINQAISEADVIQRKGKILPALALNEIFIGETLSARVSHLTMRINGQNEDTSMKCSGICICTGTGSTSWHLSINRLPVQSVAELLRLIDIDATEGKESLATLLSEMYNKNLVFAPDDKKMGYTIRDMISAGVWPKPKGIQSRGFANNLEVGSNCYDAYLVVDGGVSYPFNDGTVAILDMLPEDALRTVIIPE